MNKTTYDKPEFSLLLLHPKYWPVWLGFGLLALIVNLLPYRVLLSLGQRLGLLGVRFGKKRVDIATRNMELAFPEKPIEEINQLVKENFKNTGLALIETGITWFWPTWRFKMLLVDKDTAVMRSHSKNGKGVLLCCVHALNLEITARAFAVLGQHGYGVYRPHNNAVYNLIQFWGRTHNGNLTIDRKDVKKMIRVLRNGDRLFYLPDHDYGRNKSVFVPFFAVEDASTTTGTSILAYTSRCAVVIGSGFRNADGKYEIMANESIEDNYPQKDEKAAAAYMNRYLEKIILRAPEQWMWLHKRFKTMEDPEAEKGIRYK
ncbi:LpxL/LpxP family Kdo(2)-lipid IV(A) lauroyl/palmitoleoyl acyltransferase [Vibrio splendidus]|uniref:LpxL/LpxP family Kdo(2)-lipid IV(A) lauroyl/palmitoleoyl acyltransferase n=1 Tax=Vibrio splendidus TaxID=29497 RepID=UPI002468F1DB|nr:LpxL/LpxP family Kdo(2)-lipid IV(A) lauroyl/palmitoleoyl acyltransferase [Vibrio splendidus]MDH5933072.1 LpxL/LpxP family Kdo(2)-lipid IV(A) lauroyl/palmitoleoyl acyltransferase [Vibrio splendidus]